MSVDKAKDSFYTLHVASANTNPLTAASFKKVERLTSCGMPNEAKVTDDITSTDDRRTVSAVVDFKEGGEIEFEYVLLQDDTTHALLQTSFESGAELVFQLKFAEMPSESRQFKGIISELTTNADDTKKKLRKKGKIVMTSDSTKTLTV